MKFQYILSMVLLCGLLSSSAFGAEKHKKHHKKDHKHEHKR